MFSFFRRRRVDPKERLAKVIGQRRLPSFNGVVLRALEVLRDPEASREELARALEPDPGLSVRVLETVNSAAYSPRREVTSLGQAISLMGRSQLEALVLAIAVADSLPSESAPGFDAQEFWFQAARRATLSRVLSRRLHPARSGVAFTASLLQDLAIPLLVHSDPERYGALLERSRREGIPLQVLERETFGWDHCEVGTWICSEWGLPESLAAAIGAHHGEEEGGPESLPAVELVALLDSSESGGEALLRAAERRYSLEPASLEGPLASSFLEASTLAESFR